MFIWWFLLVLLGLIAIAAMPTWPYARRWGYYPSGIAALVAIAFLVILLLGLLPIYL